VNVSTEKVKLITLLLIVCQILNNFCSNHLNPEHSPQNFRNHTEIKKLENIKVPVSEKTIIGNKSYTDNKKLKDFMNAGTSKELNTSSTNAEEIINTAQKYLGVPHCMGGTTMKCIDCSGLLVTVFAKHGIRLPHNSEEQARYGKMISRMDELRKGDLVFFIRSYKTHHFITHSGIYVGNNKFIHTSSKNGVIITSLNDTWWKEKFVFGTRVLK
jgi:cell wall-associated NlpC family hydrolase